MNEKKSLRFNSLAGKHATFACVCLAACLHLDTRPAIAEPNQAKQPNVVFILADDLGWRDLSGEGSTFHESPHVDSIAKSGMRFTQGYAACQVCSPSRASIMTGKYPARHGITDYIGAPAGTDWKRNTRLLPAAYVRQLPADDTTMAEAFRAAGYRTFFTGKWHLGGEGSFPEDHGFDVNVGGNHTGTPRGGFFAPFRNPQMVDGPPGESLPLRLGDETANFIESHHADHPEQPFFAMVCFYSVHAPIQTTQPLWKKYRDKAALNAAPANRFIVDRTSPVRQVQDHPVYGGMVEAMDTAVGKVLAALDSTGRRENTIVVFTSDNGGVSAGDGKATSNLPLRGGKGRQWQGGIREPYYIAYPGNIAAGSTSDFPATGTDFYPTLLELAGLEQKPAQHRDGVSLAPLFDGKTLPDRPLLWHYPHYGNQGGEPSSIVIEGQWKLIHYYEDGRDELYNIVTDIGEQTDVAGKFPDKTSGLRQLLDAWLEELKPEMPVANPKFDAAKHEQERVVTREKTLPNLERQAANFLKPNFSPGNGTWWGSQPRR